MTPDAPNEKTNEVGLYHYALSYFRAAQILAKADFEVTHPEAPTLHLYYHSVELFLKSFLVFKGNTIDDVKKIGHRVDCLATACGDLGLSFDDEDIDVIRVMSEGSTIIQARYIEVGRFVWPTIEALDRTCISLHSSVRKALKVAGRPVR